MNDGIYYDIPFGQYKAMPGMNSSTLIWADKSAEHLKAAIDGLIQKDSAAMNFGRALHARLLEPAVYRSTFVTSSPCAAVLKSGDRKGMPCGCNSTWRDFGGRWFCGKHQPLLGEQPSNVLTEEKAEAVEAIAKHVGQHDVVNLLRQRGGFEATCLFHMEGEPCKMRVDKYVARNGTLRPVIIDLKKCRLGHACECTAAREIREYRYDAKAAWYVNGLASLIGERLILCGFSSKTHTPYGINVIQADAATLAIGRTGHPDYDILGYQDWFGLYLMSKRRNVWDGYTKRIVMGGLPKSLTATIRR